MKYRALGRTGLSVSEIGFGAWGIGGLSEDATSYGPTDDEESVRTLLRAFELGINFFDTSPIYGDGHSEELIGTTFEGMRGEILIASKVGFVKHGGPHDLSPTFIRTSLESSLKRLRTDYVDLYQIHSAPLEMVTAETLRALHQLRQEGLVRQIGFSVKNPDEGIIAVEGLGFDVIQVNLNLLDQRARANGLLELARSRNIGIIARTPFNFGFLTGKVATTNFGPNDHRSTWSAEQLARWAEAPDMFSFINDGKQRTAAQLALQFCLSFAAVTTVIPGMLHPHEVAENAAASALEPLDRAELRVIDIIHGEQSFFLEQKGGGDDR